MKIPAWLVTVVLNFLYEKGRDLILVAIEYFKNKQKKFEEQKQMRAAVAKYKAELLKSREERRKNAQNVLNASNKPKSDAP